VQDDNRRSYSTRKTYSFLLKRWIIPRWGNYELSEVRTVEVESWLRSLARARSTCAKIRNLMSDLFNHAWRHELFDRNPIKLVRQNAKRRTAPNVLIPAEIKLLLDNLALWERAMVFVAASTGLRQSELFALQWGDIDFSQGAMNVTRSIAYGVVGRCKTEASQKPVPVHPILAAALIQWRDRCRYREPEDWVFANEHHRGRHPYWGQAILRRLIRPVAERVGIKKRIGWHTFRHSYSTLLRSVGTEFKVMQELLRHSSLRFTIDRRSRRPSTPHELRYCPSFFPSIRPLRFSARSTEKPNHSAIARCFRVKGFEGAKRAPKRVHFAPTNARRNLAHVIEFLFGVPDGI